MAGRRVLAVAGAVAVLALLFVFAEVQGAFFAWFLFYFVTALLLYEAGVIAQGLRGVTVARELSADRLSAGQSLSLRVTVSRRGAWPLLWVKIQEELPDRWLHQRNDAERVLLPLWQRERSIVFDIRGLQRGVYRIGSTHLETGDVLGVVRIRSEIGHSDEVMVYPRVASVRGWSGYHPEELGLHQPTRRRAEESTTVLGVRDYVPGDRLSRIHWPASARRGQLQAKEFELYVTSELLFIPDIARSTFKSGGSALFELEMSITASLIKHAYDLRRQFALTMHGARVVSLPSGNHQALFFRSMQELAMAAPDGQTEFAGSVGRLVQETPPGSTVVVVSPAVTSAAAVAVGSTRSRVTVEWFVPVSATALNDAQRQGLRMLANAGVRLYLVQSLDQLNSLQRGGFERAAGV